MNTKIKLSLKTGLYVSYYHEESGSKRISVQSFCPVERQIHLNEDKTDACEFGNLTDNIANIELMNGMKYRNPSVYKQLIYEFFII
jgi:hypothetical protein